MTGRPSSFTQEIADTICERIADGESMIAICGNDDMPGRRTVLRWLEDDETFRHQYARAREAQADAMDDKILQVADAATAMTAAADRVKIDAYKWRAAKLKPKVYGEKIDVTSGGEALKAADPAEQSARLAAILAAAEGRSKLADDAEAQ